MIKFQYTEGGRGNSKRPKQNNDCTVVAIVNAFNLQYDVAYDLLNTMGRKSSDGFHFYKMAKKFHNNFVKVNLRENNLNTVRDVAAFCEDGGRFCVTIHRHVFAIVDGIVLDHTLKPLAPLVDVWQCTGALSPFDAALFS